MLDFPGVVDTELVGELDLLERLLEQPLLGALMPTAAAIDARRKCRISWALPGFA